MLIESFRQAAFGQVGWTDAMAQMAKLVGARAGQLGGARQHGSLAFNYISGITEDALEAYYKANGADPRVNPRMAICFAGTPFRSVADYQYITPRMRAELPIFTGLFREHELPDATIIPFGRAHGTDMAVALLYSNVRETMDLRQRRLLDAVAPAIAQIVEGSIGLGTMNEQVLVRTAEQLSGPAMLLTASGTLLSISPTAEPILREGRYLSIRQQRLVAPGGSHASFEASFRAATTADGSIRGTISAALRPYSDAAPMMVDFLPLPQAASGPLAMGRVLLTIRDRKPRSGDLGVLRDSFGLTPAESAIAMMVADGFSVSEIAASRRASPATVRTQLKAVFEKTGTRRQAELALLVERLR